MLLTESRIHEKFEELRKKHEIGLVTFLTGGDPDLNSSIENILGLIDGGSDIVEIGVPFSDPIADGPIIQASSARALSTGVTLEKILKSISTIVQNKPNVPIVLLTYYNPILAMGVEHFLSTAHRNGVSGVVIPDLPIGEENDFGKLASQHGIDSIRLVAPNTSESRLNTILATSRGFLYLVSLYGVTGPRERVSPEAVDGLRRVKMARRNEIPICAGFGISRPEHITSLMHSGADGVIVGSALVDIVSQHLDDPSNTPRILEQAVSKLKAATKPRVP